MTGAATIIWEFPRIAGVTMVVTTACVPVEVELPIEQSPTEVSKAHLSADQSLGVAGDPAGGP